MFTWLGGRSHEAAILWNKRQYAGDLIVDVHAAVMMDYGPMSGYDRYGDLNVTICADGRDLSSGYSVMFGGCGNRSTRIVRKDKAVAETKEFLYPPRGRGAHYKWRHVRVEKRGAQVLLLIDNKLAAEYTDPAPLTGKRVAIWTWNRGIMVARARIWAERDEGVAEPFGRARPEPGRRPPSRKPRGPAIHISSPSHPSVYQSFDRDVEGWHCPTGEHGGRVRWEPRDGGGCLRVKNARTGGDFAAFAPLKQFDAARLQHLSFDYRLAAGVKINLYFWVFGKWHVVGMTGPTGRRFHAVSESREISGRATATAGLQLEERPPIVLGRTAVAADGRWHHAAFDLLGALRAAYPAEPRFIIEDLHFGNWSNEGYLQCGFGGNRRGASYWIDNFFVGRHGWGFGAFKWRLDGARAAGRCLWKIDRSATTVPDPDEPGDSRAAWFQGLSRGAWFLHVASGPVGGPWATVRHHRFLVDVDPPKVEEAVPEPGRRAAPTALRIRLADPGGAGLAPRSLRLVVAGAPVPSSSLKMSGDPSLPDIWADLQGLVFQHEQRVSCELRAADRVGNRPVKPFRWAWTFDRSLDKTPPMLPSLTAPAPSGWDEDFEAPSDEWQRLPGSAWAELILDESTASSGKRCLRIEGGPGPFRCYVRRRPFDVRARPILSFDYMADASSRWDLALRTDKGWWVVSVNGGTKYWPVIGSLPSYTADAAWHHADLPIGELLASAKAYSEPAVTAIAVVASSLRGGQTSVLRLDAMRLVPAAFVDERLKLSWRSHDVSGIKGYSFALDGSPGTMPDAKVKTRAGEGVFANVPAGPVFFHCRALDGAGNWGPVLHQQLLVQKATDTQRPKVVELWPKPGSRVAADTIRIRITDEGTGVSAERVKLVVAGNTYSLGCPELRFDPTQGLIEWNAPNAPAFRDGKKVECSLTASDYAGNSIGKPIAWAWTMDFGQDKRPPSAPCVTWLPDSWLVWNDFEHGPGHWMGRREGWAALTEDFAATGSRCISFGGFSTFLCYAQFDAARFPLVGFDYRLESGAQLNLMVRVENRNWEIRCNSKSAKYPHIGAIEGVLADGQWHSCHFNLAEMLRAAPLPPRTLVVDHLATLTRTRHTFYVDNFFIASSDAKGIRVQWSVPRDPTGIKGYSFALDRSPSTVPDTKLDGSEPRIHFSALKPGTWYFHVRACDGAGNWGAPAHARIVVGKGSS